MKKSSKLYSIMNCKCPRCHEGNMFVHKPSLNLKKVAAMHEKCETCGLVLTPEVGYYYGAMYVSYAFATLETVLVMAALYFMGQLSIMTAMIGITLTMLLMMPFNFRWGRAGWISIFYSYDKKFASLK